MTLRKLQLGDSIYSGDKEMSAVGHFLVGDDTDYISLVKCHSVKSISGVWLLLFLNPNDASNLSISNGEAPEKLHVTVAGLDIGDVDRNIVERIVEKASLALPPVTGKVGGIGQFISGDEKMPVVALFDSPMLIEWRKQLLDALGSVGVNVIDNHGYTPHITLAYTDKPIVLGLDDDMPITLDTLSLVWDGERKDYQLTGSDEKALYITSFSDGGITFAGPNVEAESFDEAQEKAGSKLLVNGELVFEGNIDDISFRRMT